MQIGRQNLLKILRFSPNGVYLGDESGILFQGKQLQEVLLPNKFLTTDMKLGDMLEVFLYTDSSDRLVATTQAPKAQLSQIVSLRVVSHSKNGCYLDMGLDKDIFMPTKFPQKYKLDSDVLVHITQDKSQRLIAKLGIKDILVPCRDKSLRQKRVRILPFTHTPLGIGCVVEGRFYGLVYEYQEALHIGVESYAFVHKVRDDGKLDLVLQSASNATNDANKILESLQEKGFLPLCYDSDAKEIFATFGMSKKAFKRALGILLNQNKIRLIPKVRIEIIT